MQKTLFYGNTTSGRRDLGFFRPWGEKYSRGHSNVALDLRTWWEVYFNMRNRSEVFPRALDDRQKVVLDVQDELIWVWK
jgi:hypothetical protein